MIRPITPRRSLLHLRPRAVTERPQRQNRRSIADAHAYGSLTARMRVLADESDRRFLGAMAGRAVLAFLGATLGIMSVMLIGTRSGAALFPGASLFHLLHYVGLFFSTVLILRVVIATSRGSTRALRPASCSARKSIVIRLRHGPRP